MEIPFHWRDDCEHCRGTGICDNTYRKDCYNGCKPNVSTTYNKTKTKSKQHISCGECYVCKGKGWVLTELGECFKEFMEYYEEDNLLMKISDIADDRIYKDKRID